MSVDEDGDAEESASSLPGTVQQYPSGAATFHTTTDWLIQRTSVVTFGNFLK